MFSKTLSKVWISKGSLLVSLPTAYVRPWSVHNASITRRSEFEPKSRKEEDVTQTHEDVKKEDVKKVVETLKQQRDELKVKIHLAKAEAGDEWEKAEKKWEQLKTKTRMLGTEAGDASKDIGAAAKQLAKEIKHGYDRIRKLL
jgi:hypothetical protein